MPPMQARQKKVIPKRVGIFGGSFDPLHNGHVGIVRMVLDGKWADEVWVIPCWEHPFGKKMAAFEDRLSLCRLGFESFEERVQVLEVEKELGGNSFTLRTVTHLQEKNPNLALLLVLGEDAAREAPQWHQYRLLRDAVEWVVIPRGTHSEIPNVHATEIRRAIAADEEWGNSVPQKVAKYIAENKLYKGGT